MIFRAIIFFTIMLCCISCEYISGGKKNNGVLNDTIVDFSTVDVSPAFKECESLLDSDKTNCFRANIRQKFTKALQSFNISTHDEINETVTVVLVIGNTGKMEISDIYISEVIEEKLPELPQILDSIITQMPNLLPATKRGIPVTTQYELPIEIKTKE
ncbi:hypothetical protein [uncultured Tenacibaculum sp.]|uniref:hypothetical protein n=1 Tax=uncultured Tenacibaculum sp. TaxID=174713 RepID=UPI00261F3A6B|nr:hypothetical protein [uncultured Tenacibaculum sp.]